MLNPILRTAAGQQNWGVALIRHVGRKSGKQYSTPVGAERVSDGFIIPLAYGTQVDWLRNVLAAGEATLSSRGESLHVNHPELIDAEAALPTLSPGRRRRLRRLGIAHYLKITLADTPG
jgi:deazaflavin-dependent oxidoreductase (nitroreductase family)